MRQDIMPQYVNMEEAQKRAQQLLDTPLSQLITDQAALETIIGGNQYELTNAALAAEARGIELDAKSAHPAATGLLASTATVRDYLGIIAHEKFEAPLITEKARKAAREKVPEAYDELTFLANSERNPLLKFLAFIDTLTALAAEGKAPKKPAAITQGIKILKNLTPALKGQAANFTTDMRTESGLEYANYQPSAIVILNSCEMGDPKPDYLSQNLYEEIREHGQTAFADDHMRLIAQNILLNAIMDELREKASMSPATYQNSAKSLQASGNELNGAANITSHIVQEARDIAALLGINPDKKPGPKTR